MIKKTNSAFVGQISFIRIKVKFHAKSIKLIILCGLIINLNFTNAVTQKSMYCA